MKKPLTPIVWMMGMLFSFQGISQPLIPKNHPHLFRFEQTPVALQSGDLFTQLFDMRPSDELRFDTVYVDALNFRHERHQQYFKGLPVEGAFITLHSQGGAPHSLSGEFMDIPDLDLRASVSEVRAFQTAYQYIRASKLLENNRPIGKLVVILSEHDGYTPHLAYKYDLYTEEPLYHGYIFVDAHSGKVCMDKPMLHYENVPATGASLYDGTVSFTADRQSNGLYRLRQTRNGSGVETYSLNNSTNYNSSRDVTSSSDFFTSDPTAIQAHWGAEQTHDYFLTKHGRNSYDGRGTKLLSYVHYNRNYVNAFWDGRRMTYGDGDGRNYGPLVSLDITGHEIAHGVTQYSANLVYQRESGALNESFSDIFGEMVEYNATGSNDWQMGTDIGIGRSGAIRSMNNPNLFRDPDTYGGSFWVNPSCSFPSQSNDYCGVHINSGVQNKWFYILAVGESGTNDLGDSYNITGIGREKAAAIAYRNLATYLSTNSTFANARAGAIQAAIDLYGANSPEVVATTDAWYAVGVGGPYVSTEQDLEPPSLVINLSLGMITNNSASFAWDEATDNVGVNRYRIYLDGILLDSSLTTSFDLSGLEDSTSYEIIVTALDAAGNESPPSEVLAFITLSEDIPGGGGESQIDTLFAHYFESGWDGWIDGGSDSYRYRGTYAFEGSYAIRLRDNSGLASSMTSSSFDVSPYAIMDLQFYFYSNSMESGEDFSIQFYDGSSWQLVGSFSRGTDFENGVFYIVTLTLSSVDYAFSDNARFRIQCDASSNYDQIYIDGVSLIASTERTLQDLQAGAEMRIGELGEGIPAVVQWQGPELLVFPNPAAETLKVRSEFPLEQLQVYAMDGRAIPIDIHYDPEHTHATVDVSQLASGLYVLTISAESEIRYERFFKE